MDNQNQGQNISVKIPEEILKGAFANNMFVSHTKEEFILDFINVSFFPPPGQGIETAKVITTPGHVKRMVAALNDNLSRYESQFGKIEEAAAPAGNSEIGFKTA